MPMAPNFNPQASDGSSPTVTGVVPTHNRQRWLRAQWESVRRQNYDDSEVVIVHASTEDMAAAVAPLLCDRRIRLARRTVSGGASAARNTGIGEANGRFAYFLDSDEFIGHKLAHQVKQLEPAPEDVACVAGVHVLLRREAMAEIGFDGSLPVTPDWDLYVRVTARHRMIRDDVSVMRMHVDADGRFASDRSDRLHDLQCLYEKYLPEISHHRRLRATCHAKVALDALQFGNPKQARRHAVASVSLAPGDPRRWYLLATAFVAAAPRPWLVSTYHRLGLLRHRLITLGSRQGS